MKMWKHKIRKHEKHERLISGREKGEKPTDEKTKRAKDADENSKNEKTKVRKTKRRQHEQNTNHDDKTKTQKTKNLERCGHLRVYGLLRAAVLIGMCTCFHKSSSVHP